MSTIANPLTSASGSTAQTGTTANSAPVDPLANESTFLTLLVSQLQNQDPTAPMDSNQFVSQLTQYSQLEQMIGIHSDTTNISQVATSVATAANPTSVLPAAAGTNQTTTGTGGTN